MTDKLIERGAASLVIVLEDGCITVKHGTDNVVLAILELAPAGTWDKLWEHLDSLGLRRLYKP